MEFQFELLFKKKCFGDTSLYSVPHIFNKNDNLYSKALVKFRFIFPAKQEIKSFFNSLCSCRESFIGNISYYNYFVK